MLRQFLRELHLQAIVAVILIVLTSHSSHSLDYISETLIVAHPWARATAPAQKTGAGYLQLQSRGPADRLMGARSPAAAKVELHTAFRDGDVMRMREVPAIAVEAGGTTKLEPGGLHLMLIDLRAPLQQGQRVPVTLVFERAGEITVELMVQAPGAGGH